MVRFSSNGEEPYPANTLPFLSHPVSGLDACDHASDRVMSGR